MGVRLYPSTKCVSNLEVMAGVPHGTAARLEALEAAHDVGPKATPAKDYREYSERSDRFYEAIFSDEHAAENRYHSFLLNGWGKFDPAGVAPDYCGSIDGTAEGLEKIKILFRRNGIPLADVNFCEGVHWG
jgi:hypothetical protein